MPASTTTITFLPGNQAPEATAPPTTLPPAGIDQSGEISPVFTVLSIIGFITFFGLLATQWLLTRPGRPAGKTL